jgi:hypothetical protein
MNPLDAMKALETFGPYSLVVFIGIAYWAKDKQLVSERDKKDKENKDMVDHLLQTIEANTESNIKLEVVISGLCGLLNMVINKRLME